MIRQRNLVSVNALTLRRGNSHSSQISSRRKHAGRSVRSDRCCAASRQRRGGIHQLPSSQKFLLGLPRCFSSVDRTTNANGADAVIDGVIKDPDEALTKLKRLQQEQQQVNPKALFPWRHETKDNPLPRLTPGTQESLFNSAFVIPPGSQKFIAHLFLGVPVWQTLLFDWRAQLAESSSYAFTRGVAGIISNVYRVPVQTVLRDNPTDDTTTMDFEYKVPDTRDEGDSAPPESTASETTTPSSNPSDDDEEDESPNVEYMLDLPLRKLFQGAHEHGRDQLSVRLQTTPVRAVFYSLFCLPFVSRKAAMADPAVLEQMRKIVFRTSRQSDYMAGYSSMLEYVQSQVERHDRLETTVELQVLVECDEIFQVLDVATGVVVQGSPIVPAAAAAAAADDDDDPNTATPGAEAAGSASQRVWHLVTLEVTTTTTFSDNFPYLPVTSVGNWIITDIDDLLGPKKWYHK